jgi:MoaA/NifB/PqqE/SkfB family radical SAM enzyme
MLRWDHWHIEPSSICALRCPRCPRAELSESLLNRQLTLDFFQSQLGADVVSQIRKITFCGNDGDPIYCRDLVSICQWLKQTNPDLHLVIVTNGSHRPVSWWQELAQVLDARDELVWSLDGWDQHSNEQYRINSDWQSILAGIRAFAVNTDTYRVWASIAFRFNQQHLDLQRSMASDLGFDLYQLTKSTKFGSRYPAAYGVHDPLEPTDENLIAAGHRFERELSVLTERARPSDVLKPVFWQRAQDLLSQAQYSGICLIGNKGIFLNSRGELYPCCWTANRFDHNQSWHKLASERFNLWHKTFGEIIKDDFWSKEFLRFDSLECTTKCDSSRLNDQEHVTEW